MTRLFSALFALVLIAGCGSGGGEATQEQASTHEEASKATEGSAALVAPASYEGAETMTLTGKLGCGHCTHHIGTSCSAALETADGSVYILDGMGAGTEPFDQRFDGLQMKVEGKVAENQGTKFVKVDSYEVVQG